jgi:16S rRNA (guanine966-N2)-methyltransferase
MSKHSSQSSANTLRIIGGQWRGRKLIFPNNPSIRPTPDRVRETLFNWLQNDIVGANCLDMFAGSGALGFEALSRDAKQVTFVEQDRDTAQYLRDTAALLKTARAEVICANAVQYASAAPKRPVDIVFLDPPFAAKLLPSLCAALEVSGQLAKVALIYMEAAATDGMPVIPGNWSILKDKQAGQVGYYLARRN